MSINEHSLRLHGNGFDLLGIVSLPPTGKPVQNTGVVIVVGGAQYRAGSHRQFVKLARFLADGGFPVLRFDLPGMGDSPGELPSFEDTAPHIAAAIDGFQQHHPGVERVVLWGLCDGASASLLYVEATQDARVAGLALLNPWVRSEVSLARARVKHYYWQRLREPDFWRKLVRGAVGMDALKSLGANMRRARSHDTAPKRFQSRMADGWRRFDGGVLLLLSERDMTAQEFLECADSDADWSGWSNKPRLMRHTLANADHTCSRPEASILIKTHTKQWLEHRHV